MTSAAHPTTGLDVDLRIDVLGVGISAIDEPLAVETIAGWIERGDRQYVCITGVHGVMESQADPALLEIHNRSGMTTPDGMPMVWCGHRAGVADMRRVYGPDLMLAVCELSVERGWKMFFYGGAPEVPEQLTARLTERIPGLVVAGSYSPPFRPLTDLEEDDVVEMIDESGADIVWVGLSTPKQERWMAHMRPRLAAPVLVGVGAAFDMHAGLLPQAPSWMQKYGLEWLYRMMREPRRLARRYLVNNPRFVYRILRRPPQLQHT